MTVPASRANADSTSSVLGATALWLWRLANTALLAAGVWLLWRHAVQLEVLNANLGSLLDYLNVIAERLG